MNILVTAFDPFGGERINPAQLAVERLGRAVGGHSIQTVILPTAFGLSAERAITAMEQLRPDAVLSVGQAGGRGAITPERVAVNLMDARIPDNAGFQPVEQPVVPGAPAAYFSTLPVRKMAESIKRAGLAAEVSNTAGLFVCNQLLYRLLHYAAERMPHVRCGFIHVPYVPEQVRERPQMPAMELDDIVRGLEAAITAIE